MMKLFKKLLAVAMVAVLALTVLTGCDTGTNATPSNNTEFRYWQNFNNGAMNYYKDKGVVLNQVDWSEEYSKVTYQKLSVWMDRYVNDKIKYDDDYQKAIDDIENKSKAANNVKSIKFVVSEAANKEPDYSQLYKLDKFLDADYVGIARISDPDDSNKVYTMFEIFEKIV